VSVTAPIPELRSVGKPPFWRDVRVLRWVGQIAVVGLVLGLLGYLLSNVTTNLQSSGLPTGFGFLDGKYGSAIPGQADAADLNVRGAFGVGYGNTVRVILVGIPGCTLIGILIGIARLSTNLMVRTFGTLYVEAFRNVPALVWIFIFHFSISLAVLPPITDAPVGNGFVVSNRGVGIPWLDPLSNTGLFVGFIGIAIVATMLVVRWRGAVNAKTGKPSRGGLFGLIAFLVMIAVGNLVAGNPLALDPAGLTEGGRQIQGGMTIQIQYFSLTLALTLYTASHVAEVVRGAILAIHKGQTEAANAIALSTFQRYRFIILPQAFRIMIPPLANQYLNITKNSSLAIAIGYTEIASVFNIIVNNAAPAVQGVVILMGLYLTFSLSISLVANFFNRRLALEAR
jgi:general L-amino acid transport system permease protein